MKRIIVTLLTTTGLLSMAATAAAHTAYPMGEVNVRTGPGSAYGVVDVLRDGQSAPVLGREGSWLKVRTPGGSVGYMADWVTREVFDDERVYLQVDTDVLNLRSAPGTETALLGQVYQGQRFRTLERLGGWYKIDAGSLGAGWVSADYVFQVTPPPATQPPHVPPPPDKVPGRLAASKGLFAARATAMRVGRDPEYDVVARVALWESLTYLESAEGWIKVQNRAGDRGWVPGPDLSMWDKGVEFARQAIYSVTEHDWRIQFLRVREVIATGTGLALRASATQSAAVIRTLKAGDQMKLLLVPSGEYVRVMLPDGEIGWLSRNFIKPVPGLPDESVRLYQTAPGVVRLELTGQGALADVTAGDHTLKVSLAENARRAAALEVGQHGIVDVRMDERSLTVRLDRTFRHQVLERTATRTVLEIRPVVQRVEQIQAPDRTTYRFHTVGQVEPAARREGGQVVVTLPGALLGTGATAPQGLSLQQSGTALSGRITTDRAFAIKRGADHTDLVIFSPGLQGKTIVVDPGHGGIETGAIGPAGLREKDLNLAISLKLKALLEAAGAKVVMTRTADTRCASPGELAPVPESERLRYDLNCRTVVANTSSADLFLSVHSNANPSRAERGTETYWAGQNLNAPQSQALAGLVQQELLKALGLRDRGVKEEMFYVVKYSDAPAALAELGFVSNPDEEWLLKQDSFRQKAAEALFRATQRFFQS